MSITPYLLLVQETDPKMTALLIRNSNLGESNFLNNNRQQISRALRP